MVETPELPAFADLDQEQIDREKEFTIALLESAAPSAQLTRGAIHDLVTKPLATAMAAFRADAETYRNSYSLKLLAENPEQATEEAVDNAAANFRITRRPGGAAGGSLAIVVSELLPLSIPKGAEFTGPGSQLFTSDEVYTAKTSEETVTDQFDRLLRPRSGGGYVFNIDVTAADEGSLGMARKGDQFTVTSVIPGVASAYADEDFDGGLDPETNAELASILQTGMAVRTVSTQPGVEALLRSDPAMADIMEVNLIGMNDPEQQRYHAPVPIAYGGRLDVWIKAQALPQSTRLTVTATLETKNSDGSQVWSFVVARADAAGAYRVLEVERTADSGDVVITPDSYTIGVDFSDDDVRPDIVSGSEACYTRYQILTVLFTDTPPDADSLEVGDEAEYTAVIWKMPLISEAQDFLNDPDRLPKTTDVVVRAAVPVELAVAINVSRRLGAQTVDEAEVQSAVADHVQQLGFVGRLTATEIAHAAYSGLPDGFVIDKIELVGVIYLPDGTLETLRSLEVIEIPSRPELYTTSKTAFFVLAPDSVTVNVAG